MYRLEEFFRGSFTRAVYKRSEAYKTVHGLPANNLPRMSWSPEQLYQKAYRKNCENVIGFTTLPVGLVGPFRLHNKNRFLPIATTEGALVASLNRGFKLLESQLNVQVHDVGMTRAPLVSFGSIGEARQLSEWVGKNYARLKEIFEETSQHCKLQEITPRQCGTDVHIKFRATTDDAMGMNIVTKGCYAVLKVLRVEFPASIVTSVSGNYCTDKKITANNWISGRGKSVIAETVIQSSHIENILGCSAADFVRLSTKKNLVGSALAGSLGGFNAQAANVVAGIFVATGQDLAQIGTSSSCITQLDLQEQTQEVIATVTMPSVEVGVVGGGTDLPAQAEALKIAGVDSAKDLAELVGVGVLAGELSLLGSLCKGDLMKAHLQLNRKSKETIPK